MKRIIALLLCVLMLMPLAGCKSGQEKSEIEVNPNHSLAALESENYKISCGMLNYLYLYGFYSVYSSYRTYFDSMGFDSAKPFDEQAYGEDMTWHDYFLDMTLSDARTFLRVAEAAKADGYDDAPFAKEAEDELKKMASSEDMTEEEYIYKMFGDNLDRKDILDAMTLQLYAYEYYDSIGRKAQADVTDESCENYFKENSKTFNKIDYVSYTVTASTANTDDTEAAYNEAKVQAELLIAETAEKGIEGYKTWVTEYMKKTNSESTTPMEEDALASQIENTLAGTTGAAYSEGDELSEWCFEDGRKEGDCKLIDNGAGSYTVTAVTKTPYRDEALTRDVRHILFKPESYGNSEEQAKAKAEEVLAEWEAGEATAESFDALAEEHNDDGNSLYEAVRPGEMVETFNDWLFDSARKEGDTGIVQTDYGFHLMYFVGDNEPVWKVDVINTLANQTLTDLLTKYEEDYEITESEENINKITKSVPQGALSEASDSAQQDDGVNVYE